jgi:hypothetical protein
LGRKDADIHGGTRDNFDLAFMITDFRDGDKLSFFLLRKRCPKRSILQAILGIFE